MLTKDTQFKKSQAWPVFFCCSWLKTDGNSYRPKVASTYILLVRWILNNKLQVSLFSHENIFTQHYFWLAVYKQCC